MYGCDKCMKCGAFLWLLAGVLFLLQDLRVWNFWNLNWWTVAFLLFGLGKLGMCYCKECDALFKKKR